MMQNNVFSNPIIKDRIEVLENSKKRLVFRTFLEPKGGQNQPHYHSKLNETFKIIEGKLLVHIDKTEKVLIAGDHYTIQHGTNHMFLNTSDAPVTFDVEILNPERMIHALQIMYGLANNGKTTKAGLPKNIFHTTIALRMMDTFSPKAPFFIQKIGISVLAQLGKVLGIEKRLLEKYCNQASIKTL